MTLSPKAIAAQLRRAEQGSRGLLGHDGRPVGRGILLVLGRLHDALVGGEVDTCEHVNLTATSFENTTWWRPDLPQAIVCSGCFDQLAATARPERRCTGCCRPARGQETVRHLVPSATDWPPVMLMTSLCGSCRAPLPARVKRKARKR